MPDTSVVASEIASSARTRAVESEDKQAGLHAAGNFAAFRQPATRWARAQGEVRCNLSSLAGASTTNGSIAVIAADESYVRRAYGFPLSFETYSGLLASIRHIGVTAEFRKVIDYFHVPEDELPAGFRVELCLEPDRALRVHLARDISYGKNSIRRPTNVLFSADTANPYEVESIKGIVANLTCNPGIIYDLFINNPKANAGHRFNTRDEVMEELGKILGPGCDISVELNNPFAESEQAILDEVYHFREMLSEYRVVIKVPHTGPVNSENMEQLLRAASGSANVTTRLKPKTPSVGTTLHYCCAIMGSASTSRSCLSLIRRFLRCRPGHTSSTASFVIAACKAKLCSARSSCLPQPESLSSWKNCGR